MDFESMRIRVYDFVKKVYEMVDDASTDSIISWGPDGTSFIVWKPLECQRDLLTKHFQIYNFSTFSGYGFRKKMISGGQHLEFSCQDFVRGKPELLEKIAEANVARMRALDERCKPTRDRLKRCKNEQERELVLDEAVAERRKELKEKLEAAQLARAIERLRAKRLQDQMQHVQT